MAALAERSGGALTEAQIVQRLHVGGQRYRNFLHAGAASILRALHDARCAAEGEERLRMREAVEALGVRHDIPDWVVTLTRTYLAATSQHYTEAERAWVHRALREYLAPGTDTTGVPGLSTD